LAREKTGEAVVRELPNGREGFDTERKVFELNSLPPGNNLKPDSKEDSVIYSSSPSHFAKWTARASVPSGEHDDRHIP